MQVQLLGPVQLRVGDEMVDVGPPQRCMVLAVLAADVGRPVPPETLIDRVWGRLPSRGARRTVQTHIANIRGLLRRAGPSGQTPPALLRRGGGYVLDIDPDLVDVHRFRRLVGRAAHAGPAVAERVALWREAVGLWRGAPLAALDGEWAGRTRDAWDAEYRDAVLGWAVAEIEADNATVVIGPLTDLIRRYPLVEALPEMVMRALYAAGRRTDAMACYASARQRLAEELAEPPGAALKAVYQAILRHEPYLPPPAGALPAGAAVPAQLPPDVRGFAGRVDQLIQLDALAAATGEEATPVVISAIAGTAGVGKTALAVHWAHRAAKRFPDGQLYVNLRGFDPGGAVVDPAEAARGFLDALAVPSARIPADGNALTALYRTQLANKRMLIVLDNARDTEQVRPLLPGAPGCLVLVTSRSRLTSLVASTGAHPLALDLLTPDEARDLLASRLGPRRVAAERGAVDKIIKGCSGLPLALAIAAARATTQRHLSLGVLAAELDDAGTRLDALADLDRAVDIRAVFSWSHAALTPPAARLFRLLGLHPGPDISAAAAASLAGLTTSRVRPLLAELGHAHLIVEHRGSGRYGTHDLLRAYAMELVHDLESDGVRRRATAAMLAHYHAAAAEATRVLYPAPRGYRHKVHDEPSEESSENSVRTLGEPSKAQAWLDAERANLVALCGFAANHGWSGYALGFATELHRYLEGGHYGDALSVNAQAIAVARRTGDRRAEAHLLTNLGDIHRWLGQYRPAIEHLRRALTLHRQTGDRQGEARTLSDLGIVEERLGDLSAATRHHRRALQLCRASGDRYGEAAARTNLGNVHTRPDHYPQAITELEHALEIFRTLGERTGQATALANLGDVHASLGQLELAAERLHESLGLFRELKHSYGEGIALENLGGLHLRLGAPREAIHHLRQALDIFDEIGHLYGEAAALNRMGEALRSIGRHEDALAQHRRALAIATETGDHDQQAIARAAIGPAPAPTAAGD